MRRLVAIAMTIAACWFAASRANGAEIRVPDKAVAGQDLSISTSGSGEGTLLLVGPGEVIKHKITLGQNAEIKGEELKHAGRWIAIVRGGSPQSQVFWVDPAKPENLSFLARPSRVPVNRPGVISGFVFTFDKFQNLVVDPTPITFTLSVGGTGASQNVTTKNGVAWVRSSSAKKAGAAQFVAKVGDVTVTRVVQQVASDPCNLRMHVASRNKDGITVQTDPIRDCTGNPVPDGTIVTFIETDQTGRSVVDARIKKGIATAELPASANAHITVASGVVLGNELNVGGGE
ncbi:MAG TPA: hypothetical protein VJV96_08275 [Candidatus Angelobacter sp.]|jgi:hypothetical protein|nr:hypothetical protein [Candidatus Angelobacter sp.]